MLELKPTAFSRAATNNLERTGYELDISKIIIPFGIHKGKSLNDIESSFPEYIEWLIQKSCPYSWVRNDRLMEGLEYSYMRIFHRKNQTVEWYEYCKELQQYNETWEQIQNNKKQRMLIKDDQPVLVERLLHRKRVSV